MINETIKHMLLENKSSLVTPLNNVSMVFAENSLLHAIMILNNTTFTSVPVLDYNNKFIGLISTGQIFKFLGEKINLGVKVLEEYKIIDAIDKNYYIVNEDFDIEEVMRALINHNFICVVDSDMILKGIIPRSKILKKVNYIVHEFDKLYTISPKTQRFFKNNFAESDLEKRYSN